MVLPWTPIRVLASKKSRCGRSRTPWGGKACPDVLVFLAHLSVICWSCAPVSSLAVISGTCPNGWVCVLCVNERGGAQRHRQRGSDSDRGTEGQMDRES